MPWNGLSIDNVSRILLYLCQSVVLLLPSSLPNIPADPSAAAAALPAVQAPVGCQACACPEEMSGDICARYGPGRVPAAGLSMCSLSHASAVVRSSRVRPGRPA
eukprot:GHUV01026995.1.p1 GENE.GHUV01026995.1~~GHUV01026995.1.p1  ORF type:complete len:104 (-),score=21.58 GHUV01026995.1:1222-1533(-)